MVIFQQTDSDGFPHFRRRDSSIFEPSRSRDADFLEEDWTGGCPQSSFLDDCRDQPRSRLAQVSRDSHVPTGYGLALSPVGKAKASIPPFFQPFQLPRRWEMATITCVPLSLSLCCKNGLLALVPFRGTTKARPFRKIFNGKNRFN